MESYWRGGGRKQALVMYSQAIGRQNGCPRRLGWMRPTGCEIRAERLEPGGTGRIFGITYRRDVLVEQLELEELQRAREEKKRNERKGNEEKEEKERRRLKKRNTTTKETKHEEQKEIPHRSTNPSQGQTLTHSRKPT